MIRPAPIAVLGAGAFGTALAITLAAKDRSVFLWGRDRLKMQEMAVLRENHSRLPGARFPDSLETIDEIALSDAETVLLAVPTQLLREFLTAHRDALADRLLVTCCKGVERGSGLLPTQVIEDELPGIRSAVLTGPSFAADIAAGLPTALTLATSHRREGTALQQHLSTPTLRLYFSEDPIGAQLGGALKNVTAIAAGIAIGAGLGDSARAALMTRGFAETVRYAASCGARRDTLFGLSGFGDLILTCTSKQSRNFRHGLAIGSGAPIDGKTTVEGVMTAHAVAESTVAEELPVTHMISSLLKREVSLEQAVTTLMARPLRREDESGGDISPLYD